LATRWLAISEMAVCRAIMGLLSVPARRPTCARRTSGDARMKVS
jgi:hypothetical protein